MPFNINTFTTDYQKNGFLQPNRFQVFIPPPTFMTNINNSGTTITTTAMSRELTFRAEQFVAPGIALNNTAVRRYNIGGFQKYPSGSRVTDANVTFVSDRYGSLWQFWYQWLRGIYGFAGLDNSRSGPMTNTTASYQLRYKEEYAVTITILVYDQHGNVAQTINLYNCFPLSMNDTPLSWGNNNQLMRITVAITYRDFSIQGSSTNNFG